MHDTAFLFGRAFLETYWRPTFQTIVEIGSYDVNGSLREACPNGAHYVGVDVETGPGVDLVKAIDSRIPLADESADLVLCSSMLEHDDFFWNTFLDMVRLLRPGGFLYVNAPSNGWFHLYPVDNWRFYPDAGQALVRWSRRNGLPITLVESFVADRLEDGWNDFVGVFTRAETVDAPRRMLSDLHPVWNLRRFDVDGRLSLRERSEDMIVINALRAEVARLTGKIRVLTGDAGPAEESPAPRSDLSDGPASFEVTST